MLSPEQQHRLSKLWLEGLYVREIAKEVGISAARIEWHVAKLRADAKKAGRMAEFEFWSRPRGMHPGDPESKQPGEKVAYYASLIRELSMLWFEGRSIKYIAGKLDSTKSTISRITRLIRKEAEGAGRTEEIDFWTREYRVHYDHPVLCPVKTRSR